MELQIKLSQGDVDRIVRGVIAALDARDGKVHVPRPQVWRQGVDHNGVTHVQGVRTRVLDMLGNGPARRRTMAQSLSTNRRAHLDGVLDALEAEGLVAREGSRYSLA